MRKKRLFVGFSTFQENEDLRQTNWTLYDLALVKRDLMNHFYTRKGERVMLPGYGCAIWDYLMEPLTEGNRREIEQEVVRVIASETRVELKEMSVTEVAHGFAIQITLFYRPWEVYESFSLDFDRRQQEQQ